jgi:hypothetical protein
MLIKVCLSEWKISKLRCVLYFDECNGFIAYPFENFTILLNYDSDRRVHEENVIQTGFEAACEYRPMQAFVHRSSSYGAARLRAEKVAAAYAWSFQSEVDGSRNAHLLQTPDFYRYGGTRQLVFGP